MKKQNNILKEWEQKTQELTDYFVDKYFDCPTDYYWIASEIGGVLCVNDYFFNMGDIVDFIRYNYSEKDLFEFYDKKLEADMKDLPFVNIKNWRELNAKEIISKIQ